MKLSGGDIVFANFDVTESIKTTKSGIVRDQKNKAGELLADADGGGKEITKIWLGNTSKVIKDKADRKDLGHMMTADELVDIINGKEVDGVEVGEIVDGSVEIVFGKSSETDTVFDKMTVNLPPEFVVEAGAESGGWMDLINPTSQSALVTSETVDQKGSIGTGFKQIRSEVQAASDGGAFEGQPTSHFVNSNDEFIFRGNGVDQRMVDELVLVAQYNEDNGIDGKLSAATIGDVTVISIEGKNDAVDTIIFDQTPIDI